MDNDSAKVKVFFSYSHEDDVLRKELDKHLVMLKRQGDISTWSDNEILAGKNIDDAINPELETSDLILFLVSPDFLFSEYCMNVEAPKAIELQNKGKATVVPIILHPCDWKGSIFGRLKALPKDGKPISSTIEWDSINEAFLNVTEGLKKRIVDIQENKTSKPIDEPLPTTPIFTPAPIYLTDYPKPSPLFTGRKDKLKEFEDACINFRIIVIDGLGGTGKTEFAAKCIEEYVKEKKNILWYNGTTESKFDTFITESGYPDLLKGSSKTSLAVYSGLKDLIERDNKIIFWDNFQEINDTSFEDFLKFAAKYLVKSTIILITKTEPNLSGITIKYIKIEGLGDDAIVYAKKLRKDKSDYNSITDDDIANVCQSVEGHPLAIELAFRLLGYGESSKKILEKIITYRGKTSVEELIKRLFGDVFNHSKTTNAERDFLEQFSIFKDKVNRKTLDFIFQGKNYNLPLSDLIDKLLITRDGEFYTAHPLVREFSYGLLQEPKKNHKKAAEYFIQQRTDRLDATLEGQIFYHLGKSNEWKTILSSVIEKGRVFIQQGHFGLLIEMLDALKNNDIDEPIFSIFYGDIFEIKGKWDEAKEYYDKARANVENKRVKAEGMIKYGEMLYRKGNVKESVSYFEDGYKLSKDFGFEREEARALTDLGMIEKFVGKLDSAMDKHKRALVINERNGNLEGTAISLSHIGCLFEAKGKIDKALKLVQECLPIYDRIGDKEGIASTYNNIGSILETKGEISESLRMYQKSLTLKEEIGDKQGIATTYNNIGGILQTKKDFQKALEMHQKSLAIEIEIGYKVGICSSYNNLGYYYKEEKVKDYDKSMIYFFLSIALKNQMGMVGSESETGVSILRKILGLETFKKLAEEAYQKIPAELQPYIKLEDFIHEPIKTEPKLGRNDNCHCGSGKKFKNCHGK